MELGSRNYLNSIFVKTSNERRQIFEIDVCLFKPKI